MKKDKTKIIVAYVPLSEMFGFNNSLKSLTKGKGDFTMHFDHYAKVPKHIEQKIIQKNK